MGLLVQETFLNKTEGYCLGESPVQETDCDTPGEVYRFAQREYGRCTSKVYIDGTDGKARAIGWVFVQRLKYEDTGDTYLRETWVTLHDAEPTRTIEHHYHMMGEGAK